MAYAADYLLQKSGLYCKEIHVLSELGGNIACRIDLAKRELGYSPKISLREGMRRSVEWCLKNGHCI
jgi:nucleoside-diphosphate-sugar epimerase